MNGPGNILVDTNLIILAIGGDKEARELLEGRSLFISVISEIELLSIAFQKVQEERLMRDFISNCIIVNLDNEIKRQTIQLRKNHKIKIPDAIIAASSIVKRIPLFTADRGFSKIPDARLGFIPGVTSFHHRFLHFNQSGSFCVGVRTN